MTNISRPAVKKKLRCLSQRLALQAKELHQKRLSLGPSHL